MINMEILNDMKKLFTKDGIECFVKERTGKENLVDTIRNYLITNVIIGIILTRLFAGISLNLFAGVIIGIILLFPLFLTNECLTFGLAKIMRGKTTITKQIYFNSYILLIFGIIMVIVLFTRNSISIIGIPFGIYMIYLQIVMMKKIHELDTVRAMIASLPIILPMIAAIIFFM